jgi:hypothetical protein
MGVGRMGGVRYLFGRIRSKPVRNAPLGDLEEKEKDEAHCDEDREPKRHRIGMQERSESRLSVLIGSCFGALEKWHGQIYGRQASDLYGESLDYFKRAT